MTEAEWLSCTEPSDMLMDFPAKWDNRRLWLFGCACLRRAWHLLKDRRSQSCVEVAERFVDGLATEQEMAEVWEAFDAAAFQGDLEDYRAIDWHEAIRNLVGFTDPAASFEVAWKAAEGFGSFAAQSIPVTAPESWSAARTEAWKKAERDERAVQTNLLRNIFGNPFRPASFDPAWRTRTAAAIAQVIYDDRDFSLLPVLADALEDAGCENADILNHCRQPGEHVRGCWVVDLVLGKE